MLNVQIEERMSSAQELSEGWREIKEQKQDLSSLFQDMEQQLLSLSRRPAELETKIAQNMLSQAKVGNTILLYSTSAVQLLNVGKYLVLPSIICRPLSLRNVASSCSLNRQF